MHQGSEGCTEFQENVRYGMKLIGILSKHYPGISQAPPTKYAPVFPYSVKSNMGVSFYENPC